MSDKKLSGKTAVITGASKGLGKAMAFALAGAGAKLALVSRNKEQLQSVANEVRKLGTEAETFVAQLLPGVIVTPILAVFESRLPSLALNVNESVPVAFPLGV